MNKRLSILAVCSLLATPLVAVAQDDPAPPAEQHEQHAAPPGEAPAGGQSMAAMQAHMLAMRQQMERIHATGDPAERQKLMQEHMQSMQQHMQMMGAMRGAPGAGPSRCVEGDTR
jgi:hypothetical protein